MSNRTSLLSVFNLGWVLLVGILLNTSSAFSQDAAKVDFVTTIKPIFEQHCVSCHGEQDPEAFRIDLKDEAMDYVVAESAEDSELYQVLVTDDEEELMPPAEEEIPLSKAQMESVKLWIDQGAQWPANVKWVAAQPATDTPSVDSAVDSAVEAPVDSVAAELAVTAGSDHADDIDEPAVDPKTQRIFNAIGSLHPAAVHLPIGLLLAAGLFALFSLRGNFVMSDCAYYCLWLGTLGAIVACLTGWWCSPLEGKGTVVGLEDLWDQTQPVFWHRTGALLATAFAFLLALFAASARNRDPDDGVMWKLGVMVLALGIAWVGHDGGELTHGKRHYNDLNAIGADLFPGIFGEAIVEPAASDQAEETVAPDTTGDGAVPTEADTSEDQVGDTSDET